VCLRYSQHHILPNVICSGVVEEKAKTNNLADKYLVMERSPEGDFLVEGIRVVMSDMIATNGIVHVIEEVLFPESARSIDEKLSKMGEDTFKELLNAAGMTATDMDNITLFLPSEKALEELPENFILELKNEPEKLKEFLHYHMTRPKTCKCEFYNDLMLSSELADKQIRINTYGAGHIFGINNQILTAQCSKLTSLDNEVCGGMIHKVDRVMLPPAGDILQVLKSTGKYAKFQELIEFSGLKNELANRTDVTLLAPTDEAFEQLGTEQFEKLFGDQEHAAETVKGHLLPEVLCCAGITRNHPFLNTRKKRTSGGNIINMRRSSSGHLYADRASLTKCDMMATNGVVHQVDSVILGTSEEATLGGLSRMDSLAHIFTINPFKLF